MLVVVSPESLVEIDSGPGSDEEEEAGGGVADIAGPFACCSPEARPSEAKPAEGGGETQVSVRRLAYTAGPGT